MRIASVILAAVLAAAQTMTVLAQSAGGYPAKLIRVIVPLSPGGNLDVVSRSIVQQLAENLGQQVIVDNRPGASSLVGTHLVAKAAPDGYTLLAMANTFAMVPSIMANPGYDPLKDFAAITQTCQVPQVLVVNPALPVRTVTQLIALAKARPGELSYATSGAGGTGHMATELFNHQVGIRMLHVPYKGNAQAIVDVVGGQVMLMIDQVSTSVSHIKSGKLRAIAVTSLTRSPLLPELPTIDESGAPGYEDITFNGLVAPAGTPREILLRVNQEVAKAVQLPALHNRFIERGVELKGSASPEAFGAQIKAEFDKKARLAREAGIRID
jgi:tripartite-type tricarboxylate transporter receptor subunit TctC